MVAVPNEHQVTFPSDPSSWHEFNRLGQWSLRFDCVFDADVAFRLDNEAGRQAHRLLCRPVREEGMN